MPKIDIESLPFDRSTGYPPPFNKAVEGRERKRIGRAAGLTQFGVNICTLKPGASSSQRHWHENEDELVYVLEGEVVLREDSGETTLRAGDAAAWKAGVANGHCLINRSNRDVRFVEIGTRASTERAYYPDIDMMAVRDEHSSCGRRGRRSCLCQNATLSAHWTKSDHRVILAVSREKPPLGRCSPD